MKKSISAVAFPKRFATLLLSSLLLTACTSSNTVIDETVETSLTSTTTESTIATTTVATTITTVEQTTTTATTFEEAIEDTALTGTTISFTALGDNLIHEEIYTQAYEYAIQTNSTYTYDFTYAYAGIADMLKDADITILNQETLICNDLYEPSTYPYFNSPTDLGLYMAELGVDVFTIANNHILDKGSDGLVACLDFYDENELIRVGAYRDLDDRSNIRTIEIDGVTVSFLAYTDYLNGLSLPSGSMLEIGEISDNSTMLSEISTAKSISDICIVSLHWGTEDYDTVSDYQRNLAEQIGNAGADVIIGTHPHVLRDIEMIELDDGRNLLCAYSLGNLISAQSKAQNLIGGILDFSINISDEGVLSFVSTSFTPVVTHYDTDYANLRVYKFINYSRQLASAHGVAKDTEFSYDFICDVLDSHSFLN